MATLKGSRSFYDFEVSDALEYNVKSWLNYGLLEMGAYTNVQFSLPTSGYSNLKRVKDNRYSDGKVYEGLGAGWVWENDVSPIVPLNVPIVASGVHVNGVFYPTSTTSGTYQHKIDYLNGRVVFTNSIASTASVKCEYSFRDVGVYSSDGPEWRTMVQNYEEKFADLETSSPSGMAQTLKQNRIWLPAVFVEIGDRTNVGLQLGGGEINNFEVEYHVFSDKAATNRKLADVLNNQYKTTITLIDINDLAFPYNYDGTVASGAVSYKVLADRDSPQFWTFAFIDETSGGPRDSTTDVFRSEISHTVSVDRYLSTY
jgi:hypothetical protein